MKDHKYMTLLHMIFSVEILHDILLVVTFWVFPFAEVLYNASCA